MIDVTPRPQFSPYTERTEAELFLVQHGRLWTPAPRPPQVPPGERGNCYGNAVLRALDDESLTYVRASAGAATSSVSARSSARIAPGTRD